MQVGTVVHHLFWLLLPPLLIQQLSKSAVCSGMIQLIPAMEVKIAQTCVVTLQCMKRCLLISSASLQRRHLDAMMDPRFLQCLMCQACFPSY
uniref:Putative ovule protein n=1 Tax=Solanum chacoense TaxID=4108 RepID=A0A0V0INC7_SOLCH